MDSTFYREELYQMRENYNRKPMKDIRLPLPLWLRFEDPLSAVYDEKSTLLQQGKIVYANIVQANTVLFRQSLDVGNPAQIVFSTDPIFEENPKLLSNIANDIYCLKGQPLYTITPELQPVAQAVTNEFSRSDFCLNVHLGEQTAAYRMIPTIIYRKLLPKRKLCDALFPVLTAPDCKQVLILPKKYWTKNFTQAWITGTTID